MFLKNNMPYSSLIFDKSISEVLRVLQPKVFLDLGAGAGKYGDLLKKIHPATKTIAVEIEQDYIQKFKLLTFYDEVWNMSVNDLIQPKYYDLCFDIVMIGDVIEHLKKSEGLDLLNFLIYRTKWIIIEFPHRYIQNSVDGYHSEAHISAWSENDFDSFDSTKLFEKDKQRLIVLRGYLENEISIKKIGSLIDTYGK